jgi:glycosyltransferase involved in cell wall biosynthesis
MNYSIDFLKKGPDPLFSFVIPTYNRVDLLKRAIESINDLGLNLSYEIVIVDNNSDVKMSRLFVEYLKKKKMEYKVLN